MTQQKDYSLSPAPNFDAVEDIKDAQGPERWAYWQRTIGTNPDAHRDVTSWNLLCDIANVAHSFQRQAWYDHHFGQGAWAKGDSGAEVMIEKKPTSLRIAREILYPLGLIISKRDDEFRVTWRSKYDGGKPEMHAKRQESIAYYTNDIEDAIRTGQAMAKNYVVQS